MFYNIAVRFPNAVIMTTVSFGLSVETCPASLFRSTIGTAIVSATARYRKSHPTGNFISAAVTGKA